MKSVREFPGKGVVTEEAAVWLIRLDADRTPSELEILALGEWLNRSPAHREELEKLAALWGRLNVLTELAIPLGKRNASKTHAHGRGNNVSDGGSRFRKVAVAAAGCGIVGLGCALVWEIVVDRNVAVTNGLYATAVGQQTTTNLSDGSQIVLNTNSQIRVDFRDDYRTVQLLQGEALFTVAQDAKRPFRVYAGDGRIQAIGTAFAVYLRGDDVQITVTEGRVALASIDESAAGVESLIGKGAMSDPAVDERMKSLGTLSAGHIATIRALDRQQGQAMHAPTMAVKPIPPEEIAQELAWRNGVLMFSGDSLENVVKEVSRYTTVSIEIPDAAIRNMRVGGRFPVGETEVMLAALESNFNLRVTRLGHNRVVLTAAHK